MNKTRLTLIATLAALLVFTTSAFARPGIIVKPAKVGQGNVFSIKVTNLKSAETPSAVFEDKELIFGSCGKSCYIAVGAVDMKTAPGRHVVKLKTGKERKNIRLFVKKVEFEKISLTLPPEKVTPSPENMERIKRENRRQEEIFGEVSDQMWKGGFIKPLDNELSTAFGVERLMNGEVVSVHRGVDIRGKEGEEVAASNSGKVVLAEGLFYGGNTVIVDHGMGIFTVYMHLSRIMAAPGDAVSKGDVIGLVGSTGRATGPHLHFSIKVAGVSVNPMSLLQLKL